MRKFIQERKQAALNFYNADVLDECLRLKSELIKDLHKRGIYVPLCMDLAASNTLIVLKLRLPFTYLINNFIYDKLLEQPETDITYTNKLSFIKVYHSKVSNIQLQAKCELEFKMNTDDWDFLLSIGKIHTTTQVYTDHSIVCGID